VPTLESVVAYCRTPERLQAFCRTVDAEPGESHSEAAAQDVVVTITTSRDPVLRGEWLREGALVCAAGANDRRKRELDNVVLERASFVCCDSKEDARIESGDLIEPVASGVLDWLEVHELQEVVAGEIPGRQSDADIVVFKSNGLAAWDVALAAELLARARERGVGREL
jgi:ornithine cyclodeaminase/alanine dehydrogenase-like protein (mu-crystallin family)